MCKESFGKEIMNILDIIFPRRCPLCDEVIPPDGEICPECIGKAELVQEPVCKRCGKPIGNARKEYCGDCDRKKHFLIRERQYLFIRGQCNTRCIVLNMPIGVNMQLFMEKWHVYSMPGGFQDWG